ncbi:MAG: leucine-rich repeat domain-containing protein [Planctomycetes bacterium]|nr:leucine-rich repeat domain-containing protein [Planctomycetota bacterium]
MSNTSDRSNPKRRWHQYRLRTLLLALTFFTMALAAGFACWRTYIEPYRVQQAAAEKLKASGAEITWEPAGPEWMRDEFGEENFREVVEVSWYGKQPTDDDLAHLRHCTNLRVLRLGTEWSEDSTMDIMIAEFFPNPNAFEGFHATNHGIMQIEHLTNLRVLDLSNNKITGDVLKALTRMTKLEELSLNGIPIREGELQHLSHLRNLKHLSLSWTKLKTGELKYVSNLRQLEFLHLAGTSITDDDLAVLSKFEHLTTLDLSHTEVTAAGLRHVQELKNLKNLHLNWELESELKELQTVQMNCNITFTYQPEIPIYPGFGH